MLASTRDVDLSTASPPWPSSEEVVGGWQVGSGNTEHDVLFRVQYRVVDDVVSDAGQNPLHESENARVSPGCDTSILLVSQPAVQPVSVGLLQLAGHPNATTLALYLWPS
jgi:hypothetical protein